MVASRELFPLHYPFNLEQAVGARCGSNSRTTRKRTHARLNWQSWANTAVAACNDIMSAGSFDHERFTPSAAQVEAVGHISDVCRRLGPPPCDAAEAHRALCGESQSGYADPSPRVSYREGEVSLPDFGGLVNVADVLIGEPLDYWCEWKQRIQRSAPLTTGPRVPYSDPHLVKNKVTYARFVGELWSRGLLLFSERAPATLGLFFVAKKSGALRLIFDTRVCNGEFHDPAYTQLPTPGSWAGVHVPEGHPLFVAQCDVDCAFYRIRSPPGLEWMMRLPPVDSAALRSCVPEISDLPSGAKISPCLTVLPMGWSWSLYFCQLAVSQVVINSGFSAEQLLLDRIPAPDLDLPESTAAAVYVDGAAVLGTQSSVVDAGA